MLSDFNDILDRLPQRYPFLMVDQIVEVQPGDSITTIKNVTANEPHFQGHFPDAPVMPGVMIVEGLLQSGAILATYSDIHDVAAVSKGIVITMDNIRFRVPVVPGDQLIMTVRVIAQRKHIWKYEGVVHVGDVLVTQASWTGMIAK